MRKGFTMKILCVNTSEHENDFKELIGNILYQGMDDCGVDQNESLIISCINDINSILPTIQEEMFQCVITVEKIGDVSLGVKTIKNIIETTNLVLVSKEGNVSYSKRNNMLDSGFYNLIYLDRELENAEFYQIVANGRNADEARYYYGIESKVESKEEKVEGRRTLVFEDKNIEEVVVTQEVEKVIEVTEDSITVEDNNTHEILKQPAAKSAVGVISFIDQNSIIINMPEEMKDMKNSKFVVTVTAINE